MWQKFKNLVGEVVAYLVANPGTATLVGGWVVIGLAKFGLHLNLNELYALSMALVALVSGGNAAARRVRDGSQFVA